MRRSTLRLLLAALSIAVSAVRAASPSGTLVQAPLVIVSTPTILSTLTTGDFNGDGKTDLAIIQLDANAGAVIVLLGNGSGGFTRAGTFPVGGAPAQIISADLNRDGRMDLVIANYNSNNLSILLGDGRGGFTAAPGSPAPLPPTRPGTIAAGDFNRDGIPDLAVANIFGGVAILLGNGTGVFTNAPGSPYTVNGPSSVAVADFNLDGKNDLAVTSVYAAPYTGPLFPPAASSVVMLLGNGNGGFTAAPGSPFAAGGNSPGWLVAEDFNRDGRPDVALALPDGNIAVMPGNGNGGLELTAAGLYAVRRNPGSLKAGDLNGDGNLDLVALPNDGQDTFVVWLGTGLGRFAVPPISFSTRIGESIPGTPPGPGGGAIALTLADFNGDGRLDVAALNGFGGVSVLLGASAPTVVNLATPVSPVAGQLARLRAEVSVAGTSFGTPTGTVTFKDGATTLATVAVSAGVATLDTSGLTVGSHSLSAVYNGDSRTLPSASLAVMVEARSAAIAITGVANGASFLGGIGAPNSILTMFGTFRCVSTPQVLADGGVTEVLSWTQTQINFVTPAAVAGSAMTLRVACGTDQGLPFQLAALPVAPGVFTAASSGKGQGSILNQDASVNGPSSPAARGDIVAIFGTGFGPIGAPGADGLRRMVHPVTASVGGQAAEVLFAGPAPGYTSGLQQINVRIPNDLASGGDTEVQLVVNGLATQGGVTLAVR